MSNHIACQNEIQCSLLEYNKIQHSQTKEPPSVRVSLTIKLFQEVNMESLVFLPNTCTLLKHMLNTYFQLHLKIMSYSAFFPNVTVTVMI